jgi:hypothetical protein
MSRTFVAVGAALLVALGLVAAGLIVRTDDDAGAAQAHLVSMTESATAMQQAGATMQAHGQAMLDEGQRIDDADLIAQGQHWYADGRDLVQGGQWLAMSPTVPSSLVSSPSEISAQGSWGELSRTAQQMLHDPSHAAQLDLVALTWNGMAMQAQGRNMADHGRLMAVDVELMIARHNLSAQPATDLRAAAQLMVDVGGRLERNGREMSDYAARMRKSLGE